MADTDRDAPGIDEAVEAAARELARHEPIAGGVWCYCQPTDDDGRGDSLAGSWEQHLAASVVPVVAAAVRAKVLAEVEVAILAEKHKLIDGQVRAGVNAARLAVRALGEVTG